MILILLLISTAFAADTSLGVGESSFQANYRESVWDGIYLQFKGAYFDGVHVGAGGGLQIDLKPVELRGGLSAGPTTGQAFLELDKEVYCGLRDRSGNGIGLQYDILSKSSRDYFTIQLIQRF